MPSTLCYCRHVVKTSSGNGVDGEQADYSIDNLTSELRRKTFRDPRNGLRGGPSHNGILRCININNLLGPASRNYPVLQAFK
jgi:hypothetical protein